MDKLFASLDRIEKILSHKRYLTGSRFTEADVRLFTTLIRFDAVYVGKFTSLFQGLLYFVVTAGGLG